MVGAPSVMGSDELCLCGVSFGYGTQARGCLKSFDFKCAFFASGLFARFEVIPNSDAVKNTGPPP